MTYSSTDLSKILGEGDYRENTRLPNIYPLNPGTDTYDQWGWILKVEDALNAGVVKETEEGELQPVASWMGEPTTVKYEEDPPQQAFVFKRMRCVALSRTLAPILQKKNEESGRWEPIGTTRECPEEADLHASVDFIRKRHYLLVLFVGDNNEILHETPIQVSMGNGPGGATIALVQKVYDEVNRLQKRPLTWKAQSLIALDFEMTFTKYKSSKFLVPGWGVKPVAKDDNFKEVEEDAYANQRSIRRQEAPLISLFTTVESKDKIYKLHEEYKDWFSKKYHKYKPGNQSESPALPASDEEPSHPPLESWENEEIPY